jgi:hypothetical protein
MQQYQGENMGEGISTPLPLRQVVASGSNSKNMIKASLGQEEGAAKLHGGAEK